MVKILLIIFKHLEEIYYSENNRLIYSGWNKNNIEDFNNGYISANKTFIADRGLDVGVNIYKIGTGSNCDVYIGDNCAPVEYVYFDGSKDIVLATQYVAKNIETMVESIVDPSTKSSIWYGPALDDDKALTFYGTDLKNITVIITTLNPARIYGSENIPHSHEVAKDYDARIATYFNVTATAMFRKGFRELYLNRDVHVTEDIVRNWSDYEEVDICLNGNTLTIDKNISFLNMTNNVKVVITDCKGTGHFDLIGGQDDGDKEAMSLSNSTLVLNHINFNDINRTLVKASDNANVLVNYSTISNIKATSSIFIIDGTNGRFDIEDTMIATNYNATPIIALTKATVATFSNLKVFNNQSKASALVKVGKVTDMRVLGGQYFDNTSVNNTLNPSANEGVIFNIDDIDANVTIKEVATFYGNKSTYKDAGVIYVNAGTLNVDGEKGTVLFNENISNKGASIYGNDNSIINVQYASFSNSKAENYEGAAIYTKGKASISNTVFTGFTEGTPVLVLRKTDEGTYGYGNQYCIFSTFKGDHSVVAVNNNMYGIDALYHPKAVAGKPWKQTDAVALTHDALGNKIYSVVTDGLVSYYVMQPTDDDTGQRRRVIGYGAKEETKDIVTSEPASPITIDTRWFPCTITKSTEE